MADLKRRYQLPEHIIGTYIVENFCLDIKKHFEKIWGNFHKFSHFFTTVFEISKKIDFFSSKHAGLQRTLNFQFFHQRGAFKIPITQLRGSTCDLYVIELLFHG